MTKTTQAKKKAPTAERKIARKASISKKKSPKNGKASSKISLIVTTLRILNARPKSAAQISEKLKLSVPTINSCLSELEDKKLIKYELKKIKARRGRPSKIFSLTNAGLEELKKIA